MPTPLVPLPDAFRKTAISLPDPSGTRRNLMFYRTHKSWHGRPFHFCKHEGLFTQPYYFQKIFKNEYTFAPGRLISELKNQAKICKMNFPIKNSLEWHGMNGMEWNATNSGRFLKPCFPEYDFYGKIEGYMEVRRPILCGISWISGRRLAPERVSWNGYRHLRQNSYFWWCHFFLKAKRCTKRSWAGPHGKFPVEMQYIF